MGIKNGKFSRFDECVLGDSGKNLEGFDHGGKKAAYCRYKLGLYSKMPAKSVHFSFFPGSFYEKVEETA